MLKQILQLSSTNARTQPPSGGCVLKRDSFGGFREAFASAAFGRLCVETTKCVPIPNAPLSAAFGRLCVETFRKITAETEIQSAAFGRLCVETC